MKHIPLKQLFDELNTKYFEGKLKVEKIFVMSSLAHKSIVRKNFVLGIRAFYSPKNNSIYFSPKTLEDPKRTRKTMYHEMCHILVQNHGKEFKLLMSKYRD